MEKVCCNMINVVLNNGILQYFVKGVYMGFCVFMQLVFEGIGIIVGGVMCVVLEVVGVYNVLVKVYGFINLINVVCVIIDGLENMNFLEMVVVKCGKFVEEILGK